MCGKKNTLQFFLTLKKVSFIYCKILGNHMKVICCLTYFRDQKLKKMCVLTASTHVFINITCNVCPYGVMIADCKQVDRSLPM